MSRQPHEFAKLMVIFTVGLLAAAQWHLYLSAEQLALNLRLVNAAFRLGIIAGVLLAAAFVLRKHPWWGLLLGAVACYLLTVASLAFQSGIPLKWFYD